MSTITEEANFNVKNPEIHSNPAKRTPLLIEEIDPSRCRPWKFHNRDLAWLTRERCQDLISSIEKQGQMEPILVRTLKEDPQHDFEIIFGMRRWFACSEIPHQKLLACVTDADDQTCALLMHSENADSQDITEFERAFSFAQQIKSGIFKNQTEMANMMGLTQGYVSKLIRAGEIFEYSWIKDLFQTKLGISVKYAYELSVLLKKPSIYELIRKEGDALLQEKESKGSLWSPIQLLKKLISVRRAQAPPLRSTLINRGDKSIVSCYKAKSGKFSIFIEPEAKELDLDELQSTCMKAIANFALK